MFQYMWESRKSVAAAAMGAVMMSLPFAVAGAPPLPSETTSVPVAAAHHPVKANHMARHHRALEEMNQRAR